jgi:hypothetical protein
MTAAKVCQWYNLKQVIAWKSMHWRWNEGKTTMAMRLTMHFSYDVYGMVYRTVRGKKARLARTRDIVIKILYIVIFVQNNAWCCKWQKQIGNIVICQVVYRESLYFIVKWLKNTPFCNFPFFCIDTTLELQKSNPKLIGYAPLETWIQFF